MRGVLGMEEVVGAQVSGEIGVVNFSNNEWRWGYKDGVSDIIGYKLNIGGITWEWGWR